MTLSDVLPDFITKHFREVRERAGIYKHLPVEGRPTYHEIRALGSKLYDDANQNPLYLLGHTNDKMTQHYLDGHGIRWTEVKAGIKIINY